MVKGKSTSKASSSGRGKGTKKMKDTTPRKPRLRPGFNRYRSVKVSGLLYNIDDDVLVKSPSNINHHFVAKIKYISGNPVTKETELQLQWYYLPEETKTGRKPFHGARELLTSNHLDTASVHCIDGPATVVSLEDYRKLDEQRVASHATFFTRLHYDCHNQVVTSREPLELFCVCREPDNPDKLMIQCESCLSWFHVGTCVKLHGDADKLASKQFTCEPCHKALD